MSLNEHFLRQSFLGPEHPRTFRDARVGVVGLGGGGSHIVQQLAHLGFEDFVLYDGDTIEASNLNRLVGGTATDVPMRMPKVFIAERTIRGIRPDARVTRLPLRWQDDAGPLQSCDLLFGNVDSFRGRWELQVLSRRYLIPYIDIGLGVKVIEGHPPRMSGQVVLSMPPGPCLKCIGLINDAVLEVEDKHYGDAGGHPQVVWANGVLASTAVGIAVELLTDWTRDRPELTARYLTYDGNLGTVTPDRRLAWVKDRICPHFQHDDLGPVRLGVVL